LAASCSLCGVWKGFPRAEHLRKCGLGHVFGAYDQRRMLMPQKPYQCRAEVAAFLGRDFFALDFGRAARPSRASRPAPRIASEKSPLPATRANTSVPIRVAITAIACLRAALRGRSGMLAVSKADIRPRLAANA